MQDQPIAPGQTLAGKYRIERVLGAGAMGMVLAATHLVLGSRVAIKVMLGGGKKRPEHEERFIREARVASMLRSEHAGRVLDVGTTEQGATYIVMEYLEGRDLGALLEARGPLPVEEAVTYVLQACEAIAEAHALGIVHRDIKPANLFLTTGVSGAPCVKVVDFGIAKQVDDSQALTKTGAAVGSPLYMSPEQLRGSRDVDARTDIWALGVTLYQLLAGVTPFHADTLMAVVTMINLDPPTPLAAYRGDVAPNLAVVLAQCFEKDPARRWPNVSAFAAALAPHGSAASAGYAARVAKVQQVDVVPSRPTVEMRAPEPKSLEEATGARATPALTTPPVLTTLSVTSAGSRAPMLAVGLALALGLALSAAVFFGFRPRGSASTGAAGAATVTSRPETSVAPTASVAPSTSTDSEAATAAPTSTAAPSGAPAPGTATSAPPTPRAKPPVAAKAPSIARPPEETGSRR